MDLRKLKTLIDLVAESGIAELEVTEGEDKVRIAKFSPAPAAPTSAVSTPATPAIAVPAGTPIGVAAPSVAEPTGVSADAPPFSASRGYRQAMRRRTA